MQKISSLKVLDDDQEKDSIEATSMGSRQMRKTGTQLEGRKGQFSTVLRICQVRCKGSRYSLRPSQPPKDQ